MLHASIKNHLLFCDKENYLKKKNRSVFNENTNKFYVLKKLDMYLMKI